MVDDLLVFGHTRDGHNVYLEAAPDRIVIEVLEDLVCSCPVCCKEQIQPTKPLIPTELPTLPWKVVATDLFA